MTEDQRRQAIQLKLARQAAHPGQALSTGFLALDRALGTGGLPRGALTELFGPSASGKTTFALQMIARLQAERMTAAWIDAEHAFDPAYAQACGVRIEELPVLRPESAEQAFEIARQLAASDGLDLLVIDSAAALVPDLELATGLGQAGPGLHSRVLASGLRRLHSVASRARTSVLFLNQMRGRRDRSNEEEAETSAGGAPLKLHAAARIELSRVTAGRVHFRVLKNKAGAAFGECELRWWEGFGFMESP